MRRPNRDGFTLIELMIVVAIIGIMASIAIPQFANMVAKAQEGVTKGNLGTLRSAMSIYYSDNEGLKPGPNIAVSGISTLGLLCMGGKYLQSIPTCYLPRTPNNLGHSPSVAEIDVGDIQNWDGAPVVSFGAFCRNGVNLGFAYVYSAAEDPIPTLESYDVLDYGADSGLLGAIGGGWIVMGELDADPSAPSVLIFCTHKDMRGQTWSTY